MRLERQGAGRAGWGANSEGPLATQEFRFHVQGSWLPFVVLGKEQYQLTFGHLPRMSLGCHGGRDPGGIRESGETPREAVQVSGEGIPSQDLGVRWACMI